MQQIAPTGLVKVQVMTKKSHHSKIPVSSAHLKKHLFLQLHHPSFPWWFLSKFPDSGYLLKVVVNSNLANSWMKTLSSGSPISTLITRKQGDNYKKGTNKTALSLKFNFNPATDKATSHLSLAFGK